MAQEIRRTLWQYYQSLEPNKVFKYFEEICSIPHGSNNLKQISDYLVDFAKAHNFKI